MKGYLFIKVGREIIDVFENIVLIDKRNGLIKGANYNVSGIDFSKVDIVVTDLEEKFKIGDFLPEDLIDLSNTMEVQLVDDIIDRLGEELTKLKLELISLKGSV